MGVYGAFKSVVRARVEKYGKEKLREELLKPPVKSPSPKIVDIFTVSEKPAEFVACGIVEKERSIVRERKESIQREEDR